MYPFLDDTIRHLNDVVAAPVEGPVLRQMEYEPIAFFIAHKWEHEGEARHDMLNIMGYLIEHDVVEFVIAHEISLNKHKETDGHHYHFVIYATDQKYKTFIKWFKDNYNPNLRGRAKNGKPRQYGKVQEIRDEFKMLAYTIKDGHYASTIPEHDLEIASEISYEKEQDIQETLADLLIEKEKEFLHPNPYPLCATIEHSINFRYLTQYIINEYKVREKRCSAVTVKKIITRFLWESSLEEAKKSLENMLIPKI